MQSVYSSAAHAGIRGVSPLPPMPQSPTTKFGHVQSDGRSRARQAPPGRSQDLFAGRSKVAPVGPRARLRRSVQRRLRRVGPRSLRWSVQGGTGRSKGKASPVGPKISALVGPKRPRSVQNGLRVGARRPRVGARLLRWSMQDGLASASRLRLAGRQGSSFRRNDAIAG